MTKEEKQIVSTAYHFVIAISCYDESNALSLSELFEIRQGNKKVLLEHLKATNSIIGKAIKLLGDVEDDSTK